VHVVTIKGLWARKRRFAGTIVAIVLGVSFLAGALALGDTLNANFSKLFTTAGAGTDAVVRSATTLGNGPGAKRPPIPAALAATVRRVPGVADAQASITGFGELIGSGGKAIGGIGPPRSAANWISDPALTPYRLVAGHAPRGTGEVVVNRGAAIAGNLHLGQTITVQVPAPIRVTVAGIATFGTENGLGASTYTAFSLAGAERYIAGRPGQVSSILVRAVPGVSQASLAARIRQVLPPGVEALTGGEVTQQNISDLSGEFLTALRIFLLVFAGIALLVAAFTIASTFSIVVAQRTREAALLRSLGATRRQIMCSVLAEALTVGIAASALGIAGGLGIAGLLKGVFDSFGFALPAGGLVVRLSTVAISLLAGTVLTVGASLVPALRASRVPPLEALRESAAEPAAATRPRAVAGAAATAAGLAVVVVALRGSGNGVLGLVALGALLSAVGFVVLAPVVAAGVTGVLGRPMARLRGAPGVLARKNAMRSPRRSAAAATALMIGVAVVTLFTVYAASLRAAATRDTADAFTGDVAITSAGFGGGSAGGGGLTPQLAAAVAKVPGVAVSTGLVSGQASVGGQAARVTALDPAKIGAVLDLHVTAGSLSGLRPGEIAISQHLAGVRHWGLGTLALLALPDGTRSTARVGAVYASRDLAGDYVLPVGMWAPHAAQLAGSSIFVKLSPGASVTAAETAIRGVAAGYGKPVVEDHAAFAAAAGKSVSIFLGIVYVLLVLAIVIAVSGIANTLSLAVHERTREIGMLRAVGQTQRQLKSMVRLESVIVSLFGTVGGLVLGVYLGWALAQAGDKAEGLALFTVPVTTLAVILVLGAAAGIVAAIRPARRAARLPLLVAIATE
jgi:putative ABC transport system permease protein